MSGASDLFEGAIAWLQETYDQHGFFAERDVVWTVQKHLIGEVARHKLPFRVFSECRVISEVQRPSDLVLMNEASEVEVAAEFKYEPSRQREDFPPNKLISSVVFWGAAPSEVSQGVAHDVQRVRDFVELGRAKVGYAVFVDEARRFRHREPFIGSRWIDWEAKSPEGHSVSILWAHWPEGW